MEIRPALVVVLLAAWALQMGLSVVLGLMATPTDMGFTAGLNRITAFLGWQLGGAVAALLALALSRRLPPGPLRRVVLGPAALALLLLTGIAGVLTWAWAGQM